MTEFYIGQIFQGDFPIEAHNWAVNQDCYIKLIDSLEDGTRQYQIVSIEENPFYIGQIFIEEYPPQAADFCNERQDCYIEEIESLEDSTRRFQIVAVPSPTLEEVQAQKLEELDTKFLQWYENDATVKSSLGFVADSDARAMMDVSGLVTTLEATPEETRGRVAFMDHDNQTHMLSLEQMKTVQLEIIKNGQNAYSQKWAYRSAIEDAKDADTITGIDIVFKGEDF